MFTFIVAQPGDSIGVYPPNSDDDVQLVMQVLYDCLDYIILFPDNFQHFSVALFHLPLDFACLLSPLFLLEGLLILRLFSNGESICVHAQRKRRVLSMVY